MAQETAINWLRKKLEEAHDKEGRLPIAYTFSLLNKAEQMEKEQIEMAFAKSYLIGLAEVNYDDVNRQAEQYYNETYNTQNK